MARDGLGVTRRRAQPGGWPAQPEYHPERQVSLARLRAARAVLAEMLDGGEMLTHWEAPMLRPAISVLDGSITASIKRATRRGEEVDDAE